MSGIHRTLRHSGKAIDRAGRILRDPDANADEAERVYDDWRTLHEGVLVSFRQILSQCAKEIDPTSVVVSRLKRLDTVRRKLRRERHMALSRMEDIGGMRVVLQSCSQIKSVIECIHTESAPFKLKRLRDYIEHPAMSGYRGVHLIFSCESHAPEHAELRGLSFEVQLRSRLQHAWATAVEAAGTFRGEDLKSGEGNPEWLRLFTLVSGMIADHEGTRPVSGTPRESNELWRDVAELRDRLDVDRWLSFYRHAPRLLNEPQYRNVGYFVLKLTAGMPPSLAIMSFRRDDFATARRVYQILESMHSGDDIVLVAADSLAELERGYPNYYADTVEFSNIIYGRDPFTQTPFYVTHG